MTDPKLLAEIKGKSLQYVNDVTHDWTDLPGAIAEAALVDLVATVARQFGGDTTIADVAALLGMDDVIEGFADAS